MQKYVNFPLKQVQPSDILICREEWFVLTMNSTLSLWRTHPFFHCVNELRCQKASDSEVSLALSLRVNNHTIELNFEFVLCPRKKKKSKVKGNLHVYTVILILRQGYI